MKAFVWIYSVLALLLALAVTAGCLLGRDAQPLLLKPSGGISACAEGLAEALSAGDLPGASVWLLGHPVLDGRREDMPEAEALIWDAFLGSLFCRAVGSPYATPGGAAQDVIITGLRIPELMEKLRHGTPQVMAREMGTAADMSEVYGEDLTYRQSFVDGVLIRAAREAISRSPAATRKLTLTMLCREGKWLVVPDAPLMQALSGGILEG